MSKRQRNTKIKKKDIRKFCMIVIIACVVLIGCIAGLKIWEDRTYSNTVSSTNEDILETKEIEYNGVTYKQKRKVNSYLFIGVDEMDEVSTGEDNYSGGQGDAQMLLVIDDLNRTWRILQINRDTMTDIPVLGISGDVVGSMYGQICLAHSFGTGKEDSCENNVSAVSSLLDDQQIDGYFAMNMGAIGTLNDLVGGVSVTVTSDFSSIDPTLAEGETITLTGDQAYEFVHSRKDVDDQTNLARMSRQRTYMDGLLECVQDQGADFAQSMYDALSGYVVTDIESGDASKIYQKIKDYTKLDLITIDGENEVGEDDSWEYHLDETSLQETIIELFYEEK